MFLFFLVYIRPFCIILSIFVLLFAPIHHEILWELCIFLLFVSGIS